MSAHMLLGAFAAGDSKPLDFVLRIDRWDSVLVSTLYTTQEVLGGIVAVYQCFVLWNKNWRVITLPVLLLSGKIAIGYTSCAMFSLRGANQSVFAPSIHSWIQAFYYLAVFQNFTTTSLMGYRIWNTRRKSSPYQTKKDTLLPLLRIVIECPALQLATEILLLILFSRGRIEHYIIFQMVTPIVGISFNAVIIRVRLRALEAEYPSYQVSEDPIQTIGHTRTRIAVQMTTEIEVDDGSKPTPLDVTSEADIALYNRKDHEAVSLEAKKTQDFTNERLRLD
ncbi:hypothetical protein ONZ45_g12128 [Pleurotus djamor]|nr:hypothetical protein ONZ45_g12128 [Pleurotus djamor]